VPVFAQEFSAKITHSPSVGGVHVAFQYKCMKIKSFWVFKK